MVKKCKIRGCGKRKSAKGYCHTHYSRLIARPKNKNKSCAVSGCEQKVVLRGMCGTHWRRSRKFGDPLKSEKGCAHKGCVYDRYSRSKWCLEHFQKQICSVAGCGRSIYCQGLCPKHRSKLWRHGSPTGGVERTLNWGFSTSDTSERKHNPRAFLYWSYLRAKARVKGTGPRNKRQYYKFDPICTIHEWMEAFSNDPDFLKCFKMWQLSGFQARMYPVPDHDTDNGLGYTVRNIEWVPTYVNNQRASEKRIT